MTRGITDRDIETLTTRGLRPAGNGTNEWTGRVAGSVNLQVRLNPARGGGWRLRVRDVIPADAHRTKGGRLYPEYDVKHNEVYPTLDTAWAALVLQYGGIHQFRRKPMITKGDAP